MEWDEIQRGMVVFAHPDDAEFGSAGTVGKLGRDGKEVVYVVVTDGSKGSSDPEMSAERLITTRQAEQRDAAAVLGVQDGRLPRVPGRHAGADPRASQGHYRG